MIGFVSPYLHDDRFMHDITLGVEEALDHQRFLLVHKHIHVPAFREEDVLPRVARQVQGLILLSTMSDGAHQAIRELVEHRFPLVLIDRFVPDVAASYVVTDNVEVGILATEHLIGLGHRRIAHLTHHHPLTSSMDRETGYRVAMQRHGLAPWVEHYDGYDQVEPVLDRWLAEELPSAVFVVNDSLAMSCYRALRQRQVRVPAEVSLIGVDGNPDAALLEVPLTTVAQPKYQIGFKAAQMLQGLLRGQAAPATGIVLEPKLVVRASTAPPQAAR
jgi:LacI family transcriptional regulator